MKKFPYPTQMASIKLDDWRLQQFIEQGASKGRLDVEDEKLRKQIEEIGYVTPKLPRTHYAFPKSQLIGMGWEWAVYLLADNKSVVKVPAGVFKEVNEPEYLNNSKFAYEICKKYLGNFVVDSKFQRIKTKKGGLNTIKQEYINGDEITNLDIVKLSKKTKNYLIDFASKNIKLLNQMKWLPDMQLGKEKDGRWKICNIFIKNERPTLFDFTSYCDIWRFAPHITKRRVIGGNKVWSDFLDELRHSIL